jgi:putative ABC transport system ATP-binding protein
MQGKIEVVALSGLTCDFNLGEITVIMGPSGCGKTTLLNMIGGLDTLDSGNIFIGDKDITQLTSKKVEMYRKDLIGFVFQFSSLISELTAQENIELPITLTSGMSPKKKQYISELLDIVDLTDRKNHRPDELSGGEQQRVGVAAALANDPDIILCDEPTGELDSLTKVKIMNLLRDVIMQYPNKAMVIVSHDPDMRQIADKLYYIRDGKISHKISNAELEKIKSSASPLGGSNTTSSPGHVDLKEFLIELREIEHLVKSKIDKVEHQLHPL